jgi:uncharacterized membrane protein
MKAYWPWLLVYIFANIGGALTIYNTNTLIGDVAGNPLYSVQALFLATVLVVLSYVIILWPLFGFFNKIKIKKIFHHSGDVYVGERIGKLLFILQVAFIIFNTTNGVNIAGSNNIRTTSIFSLFWVLVPIDTLFFIYYGMHRENKYFYPNLAIWLLSNILRGWSGVLMFVIFFEWCRAVRKKKVTAIRTMLALVFAVTAYPVLMTMKWLFRTSAGDNFSIFSVLSGLAEAFSGANYFSLINDGINHLIGRLQVVSMVVEAMRLSDLLQAEFSSGKFVPFWLEGLHGVIINKLLFNDQFISIGVAFTKYGNFSGSFNIGDWNINIGYVGWFFIAPFLVPVYILYTFFLGVMSFYFVKKIGVSESSLDMLWLAWYILCLLGWLHLLDLYILYFYFL